MTSPASLFYKDESDLLSATNWEEEYTRVILPRKLAIDLEYFSRNTIWTDIILIMKTLVKIHDKDANERHQ